MHFEMHASTKCLEKMTQYVGCCGGMKGVSIIVIVPSVLIMILAISDNVLVNKFDSWALKDPVIDMNVYCSDPMNSSYMHDKKKNASKSVVILMHDTRSPCQRPVDYHQLAAKINGQYASRHGYSFLYIQHKCPDDSGLQALQNKQSFKDCTPCSHPVHGPRAASWCKLLGINATMHQYPDTDYIVYMDSDAIFFTQSLGVEWIYESSQIENTVLTLFYNYPWNMLTSRGNEQGCAGIMFWRNSPRAKDLLQEWWDFPVETIYNRQHDYEQAALHAMVESKKYDMDPSVLRVLKVETFTDSEQDSMQYILHMNPPNWKRILGFDNACVGAKTRLHRAWDFWQHISRHSSNQELANCSRNCG